MISFKEYRDMIAKSLTESPVMDDYIGINSFDAEYAELHKLMAGHSEATDLGNSYYHQGDDEESHFYHIGDDGKIDARSNILDGTQILLKKRPNVSSDVPLNLVKHALNYHGRIESDSVHTKGSRKFWQNLSTHFPDATFKIKNLDTGNETKIDPDILKTQQHKIWDSKNSHNLSIVIEK